MVRHAVADTSQLPNTTECHVRSLATSRYCSASASAHSEYSSPVFPAFPARRASARADPGRSEVPRTPPVEFTAGVALEELERRSRPARRFLLCDRLSGRGHVALQSAGALLSGIGVPCTGVGVAGAARNVRELVSVAGAELDGSPAPPLQTPNPSAAECLQVVPAAREHSGTDARQLASVKAFMQTTMRTSSPLCCA